MMILNQTTLIRRFHIRTEADGPGWFTTVWWAVVGPQGAVSYNLWAHESEEHMRERIQSDDFSDCAPPYFLDADAELLKQQALRPRSNGITIHYPCSQLMNEMNQPRRACDWFEAPCEISSYDRAFDLLLRPPLIVQGQEVMYQKLEAVYAEVFQR